MSKLLFIFERDMPTISTTRDVFSHLRGHMEIRSDFMYLADIKPSDIDGHDVIVLMRPNDIYSWRVADAARRSGHVTVTYCDDDLLNLPSTMPTIPWRKRGLLKTLAHSDVIWSPSRYIAERYRTLTAGKRMAVSDTILQPDELQGIEAPCNERVRIVYAAGAGHAALFEKYIAPIVPRLVQAFNPQFTFVSVHPELPGVECEYVAGMPLMEYRRFMREGRFDIGLAPLHSDDFSKCKYFNKYIEYTTQGIVGVYSKTEPYTYVVKDGENGFLAENDPEDWLRALRQAIADREKRRSCVENAMAYLRTEHSEDACIERLRQGLPEIIEAPGSYKSCADFRKYRLPYRLSRLLDWFYLLGFYLKHTGLRAVILRAKTHIVEAKAYSKR